MFKGGELVGRCTCQSKIGKESPRLLSAQNGLGPGTHPRIRQALNLPCCHILTYSVIVLKGILSFRADVHILRSLNITEMGREPTSAPETSALKTGLLVSRACREHGLQGLFWPHCFWGRCYFWYHCQLRWQASWKSEAGGT